jgi:hypothetical protein
MDLPLAIRGSSGRQGVFLTGKPQQLIFFPDGIVVVSAKVALGLVATGAGAGLALDTNTARKTRGLQSTGQEYAERTKRARFWPYDAVVDVHLGKGFPGRKLTYVIDGRKHLHAYGPRAATDEAFVPLLEQVFADRFHDDRPQ